MDDLTADLRRLIRFTSAVRELNVQLPTQCLEVLLNVAVKPGIRAIELQRATALSHASISRNLSSLARLNRHDKPGYGLVEQVPSALDARAYEMFLTEKGRDLIRHLLRLATGKPADSFSPRTVR